MPCVCRLRTESVDKKRMASALYGTRAGLIPVVRFRGVRAALVHFIDPCSRALARLPRVFHRSCVRSRVWFQNISDKRVSCNETFDDGNWTRVANGRNPCILPVPKAPILQLHDTTDTNRLRRQTLRYLRVPFGSTILSCLT